MSHSSASQMQSFTRIVNITIIFLAFYFKQFHYDEKSSANKGTCKLYCATHTYPVDYNGHILPMSSVWLRPSRDKAGQFAFITCTCKVLCHLSRDTHTPCRHRLVIDPMSPSAEHHTELPWMLYQIPHFTLFWRAVALLAGRFASQPTRISKMHAYSSFPKLSENVFRSSLSTCQVSMRVQLPSGDVPVGLWLRALLRCRFS